MFPLKDNIPAKHFPVVNLTLIVLNIIAFGYQLSLGDRMPYFIVDYGFIPARFIALQSENWLDVSRFIPVFTSMFLHGNLIHIFSNIWMLWIFGDNVEDSMGHVKYVIFYILCGIASIFVQTMFSPESRIPMVGASGAISGVLGAYFILYPRAKIVTFIPVFILFYLIEVPAFFFLGFWIFLQFMQGSVEWLASRSNDGGGVAWWAHVGGFGAGFLLVHFFRKRTKHLNKKSVFVTRR